MQIIEEYIKAICMELEISIPKVSYDVSKFPTDTMMAMVTRDVMYIKKPKNGTKVNADLLFSIAHELRHIWQIDTDEQYFMQNYKGSSELDVESYNMQLAEIDANAYACLVMMDEFGVKPQFNGLSERVRKAIYDRVEWILREEYE